MTELVGSGGTVSAIDLALENIRTVEKRAKESDWPAPVTARVGTVVDLPYDDDSFDAVWCANTTQYLSDDELRAMVAEYRRLTRPGGLVAIKEYDVTAQQVQPSTPTLFIHLVETMYRNGSQYHCSLLRAIELPKWLRQAGLVELRQKPTLMVRFQPLDRFMKQLLTEFLQYCNQQAQQVELPEEESRLWKQLADTNSPDHICHHPDFQYRGIQTVFVGHVPE
jgi:2-polyprenyl-3-methyl-5-hydroxy-6-metoxy-1,4-benzoquinol methylase